MSDTSTALHPLADHGRARLHDRHCERMIAYVFEGGSILWTPCTCPDRYAMRVIANRERAEAQIWWERHLDEVYADLGLDRPKEFRP